MTASRPVVLATGGTGGHVFPALALAEELICRGLRPLVTADARGTAYLQDSIVECRTVRAATPTGRGLVGKLAAMLEIGRGVLEARRLLRLLGPDVVVGFGGYPSLPVLWAACDLGLPTVLHEQNAVLGRVNRLLARRVRAIALSFDNTARLSDEALPRTVTTGNPVRAAIRALHSVSYQPTPPAGPVRLLVLGGSQGASVFSAVVPAAVAALPEPLKQRLSVVQQAPAADAGEVAAAFSGHGVAAEVAPFFDDVPERMRAAHLVISRAGAGAVAELAAAGRPSLLVPYPHALDDHQMRNAEALVAGGGAWMLAAGELTPLRLATLLAELLQAPDRLAAAAAAARRMSRIDAAPRLADLVMSLVRSNGDAPGKGAEERRQAA